MAIILDECGYPKTEFLRLTYCTGCGVPFREDESDWISLCQSCGEAEDEEAIEALLEFQGKMPTVKPQGHIGAKWIGMTHDGERYNPS